MIGRKYRPTPSTINPQESLSQSLVILGGQLVSKPSYDAAISRLRQQMSTQKVSQGRGFKSVMQVGILSAPTSKNP